MSQLTSEWRKFVREYGRNLAYWYQPKGLAITVDSVAARLSVLSEFENRGAWRHLQSDFIRRLNDAHISEAETDWEGGGAPLARMLKQVMTVLGLAWIDEGENVEILDAGRDFLEANDKVAVLSRQALRYQFWNPAVRNRDLQPVRLHPVPFLVRLLQAVGGSVSKEEYRLFVAKAQTIADVDKTADLIEAYRALCREDQQELLRLCDSYHIGGQRRSSIYNTIRLNQSYAYKMWSLSELISVGEDQSLILNKVRGEDRDFLDDYISSGEYINFKNAKEFVAWMGDPKAIPNRTTALDVYIARGDLEAAALVKGKMGSNRREIKKFRKMMIDEKTLEDHIEKSFDDFVRTLGCPSFCWGGNFRRPLAQ